MGPCNRGQRRICTEEREGVSIVKGREGRGAWVHWRTTEEEVYQTLKTTSNSTGVFCRKEEQMVQNYKYLNEWTIENNYPLPLNTDIVENIGIKKVFAKLDLQGGYNNIWIKEGDK